MPVHITSESQFTSLHSDNQFVLLDFTASWCPPCKAIAPFFAKLSDAHSSAGELAFAKVDVDEQPKLAARYNISAMPTFILLKNGEPTGEVVQGASAKKIQALVANATAQIEEGKKQKKTTTDGEAKKEVADVETVSGSYTMSSNPAWKTAI